MAVDGGVGFRGSEDKTEILLDMEKVSGMCVVSVGRLRSCRVPRECGNYSMIFQLLSVCSFSY